MVQKEDYNGQGNHIPAPGTIRSPTARIAQYVLCVICDPFRNSNCFQQINGSIVCVSRRKISLRGNSKQQVDAKISPVK